MSAALAPTLSHDIVADRVCAQHGLDRSVVRTQVEAYFDAGLRDPSLVAVNTATVLFGEAGGRRRAFPPWPGAAADVRCAFDLVVAVVDDALRNRGLSPDDPAPVQGIQWRLVATQTGSPDLHDYPWASPTLHVDGAPAPSTVCRVPEGISDVEFLRAFVANALRMADLDPQIALQADSKISRRLRKEARDLLLASTFNDARVTSNDATLAGGRTPGALGPSDAGVTHVLGPRGRGLVWSSLHYDDVDRMSRGLAPKRGITTRGVCCGSGRSPMTLWAPAVNLFALRGASPELTVDGMTWPDGTSTLEPPPAVVALGIDTSGQLPDGEVAP